MAKYHEQLKEQLKQFLQQPYDGADAFLENVIYPVFGRDNFENYGNLNVLTKRPDLRPKAEATGINEIRHIGGLYVEGSQLDIFDITLDFKKQLQRNRVEVQQIVRSIISSYSGAFIIFHYGSGARWEWRFTFFHKGASVTDATDAKRYTFLLGPGQSCRTAAENFVKIFEKIDSEGEFEMDDIVRAFDVEALSKEFFGKYKAQYEKFCQFVYDHKTEREWFGPEFEQWEDKRIRDYVKRMLGRIVFLHFLQKKGWLGVPTDKEWGEGDMQFMKDLFDQATPAQQANYLDEVLEPLFADALDTDRTALGDLFDTHVPGIGVVKVPYLNGGLFEKDEMDEPKSVFPAEYFRDIFTFFYQYNFTIDENDSDDTQVGVDPEMLGRIFENLLEDNKDKGAFYTPKEIVQYMCRESLVAYLTTSSIENGNLNPRHKVEEAIRQLVHHPEEIAPKMNQRQKNEFGKALRNIKICDPAIGSGAFPMGLLNELVRCRVSIDAWAEDKNGRVLVNDYAALKREIVNSNIYGVDIERGAIDIARLRFWLSIVVDERNPHALPNFDYKFMQGNSLITTFAGTFVNLSSDQHHENIEKMRLQKHKLYELKQKYYTLQGEEKYKTNIEIKDTLLTLIALQLGYEIQKFSIDRSLFGEEETFSFQKVRSKLTEEQQHTLNIGEQIRKKLHDESLSLRERSHTDMSFFDWRIMFTEVFDKKDKVGNYIGGFDIVIGNPPYISAPAQLANEGLSRQREDIIRSKKFESLYQKWDLYIPFIEHGIQLLHDGGMVTMIVPYPLTNQTYGKKLREMIVDKYSLDELCDLNGTKIFENATVSNCIPFVRKTKHSENDVVAISHIDENRRIARSFNKPYDALTPDSKTAVWNVGEEERNTNRHADMPLLGDFCYISKGMVINADEKTAKGEFKKEDLISNTYDAIHCRKYIEAKDIEKYRVKRVRYLEYNTERCPDKLSRPTFKELYNEPRLIMNCLGTINTTIDIAENYLHNHSIYCAVPWCSLKHVQNKSISASVKRYSHLERDVMEDLSETVDLHYLLAIMNSRYADVLLTNLRGGDYHIYPEHIRNIPIAPATKEQQLPIITLVDEILSAKKANPGADTSALEAEIDRLVYDLYGLTEEEIAIVEGTK